MGAGPAGSKQKVPTDPTLCWNLCSCETVSYYSLEYAFTEVILRSTKKSMAEEIMKTIYQELETPLCKALQVFLQNSVTN